MVEPTKFSTCGFSPGRDPDFLYTREGHTIFPKHHCKKTFNASFPFVGSWRNAIDIGCRDGEFTNYLQRHFAHVYCFDPRVMQLFLMNADLSKVTHYAVALGDGTEDQITMWGGLHHLQKGMEPISYPCVRLDDFNFENIDYIKIDTNGYELQVLRGGEQTIVKNDPLIVIEQEQGDFSAKFWLQDHGYSVVAVSKNDYVMMQL